MRTWCLTIIVILSFALRVSAGVIVVANFTSEEIAFSIEEQGDKPHKHTIAAHHVIPIAINGPADLKFPIEGKGSIVRIDPANAYVFIPDRAMAIRIEALELPGKPPVQDAKPEPKPTPRTPVKIPVTLMVDDVDPRADKLWQTEVKKRFDAAAEILEAQTGFRFELAGFDKWSSDPKAKDLPSQLTALEAAVKVKPGTIALGYTSRKFDDNQTDFGACRGMGASHILIREWLPKSELERVEVLVHYLAVALGAINSPDPGSVMRTKLGDGKALFARYVIRLDPLNALALNLIADQRRKGFTQLESLPGPERTRLNRVYAALLLLFPGDQLAIEYSQALEKEIAKGPDPNNPDAGAKRDTVRAGDKAKKTEAIRTVIRAITERAKANRGPAALVGDELTAALIRSAAEAAQSIEESNRISAFLLGIGVAFDDTNSLRDDPLMADAILDVETYDDRLDRLAVLGNPTLRNRRDLCRRFALGCATGEFLAPNAAENAAISRVMLDQNSPTGLGFPVLSAEFAGIAMARNLRENPDLLFKRMRSGITAADIVPTITGFRDGLGPDKFEDTFGGVNDDRFRAVIVEIRKRIQSLSINKTD